jgi:hypothetical protein
VWSLLLMLMVPLLLLPLLLLLLFVLHLLLLLLLRATLFFGNDDGRIRMFPEFDRCVRGPQQKVVTRSPKVPSSLKNKGDK